LTSKKNNVTLKLQIKGASMIIEFCKVRPTAVNPKRANPSDAGLDVFYCPEDKKKSITIRPGQNAILPTGLKFGLPHGYMLQVMNRSSLAAKRNLIVGAHCIDAGYDGEVFIDLHNIGLIESVIKPGDKIAQLTLVPVVHARVIETSDDLYADSIAITERGDGALGSTGT
jgi:dUTP pyrophosphatase|tara:strand:+ start:930 stop:1439 length:510 start_codon:yes stop_codon:yes gene_type:complete